MCRNLLEPFGRESVTTVVPSSPPALRILVHLPRVLYNTFLICTGRRFFFFVFSPLRSAPNDRAGPLSVAQAESIAFRIPRYDAVSHTRRLFRGIRVKAELERHCVAWDTLTRTRIRHKSKHIGRLLHPGESVWTYCKRFRRSAVRPRC